MVLKKGNPSASPPGLGIVVIFYYTKIYLPTETRPAEKNFIFSPMIQHLVPKGQSWGHDSVAYLNAGALVGSEGSP